jgi:hypothetical protein
MFEAARTWRGSRLACVADSLVEYVTCYTLHAGSWRIRDGRPPRVRRLRKTGERLDRFRCTRAKTCPTRQRVGQSLTTPCVDPVRRFTGSLQSARSKDAFDRNGTSLIRHGRVPCFTDF